MPARVVDEVAHDARERVAPSEHAAAGHPRRVDRDRTFARALLEHDLVEVDLDEVARRRRSRRGGRARRGRRPPARAARPPRARAGRRRASRCGRGGAARPRAACGSTRPGCAARATRRTRSGVGAIAASSSRSSISFIVTASARDLVVGLRAPGTRRWIVVPVIDAASARIASTGRRARPAKYHVSRPTSRTSAGKPMSSASVMLLIVSSTSASDRCDVSVIWPCGRLDDLSRLDVSLTSRAPRRRRVRRDERAVEQDREVAGRRAAAMSWDATRRWRLRQVDLAGQSPFSIWRRERGELLLVGAADAVDEVAAHLAHEHERTRARARPRTDPRRRA